MVEYPIPPIRARRDDTSGSGRSHRRDPPDQHRQRTEPLLAFPEMETLTQMKCVACRKDAPTVTDAEIAEFQPQVSDWEIVELDGIKRLRRVFSFDDFAQALGFTKTVGERQRPVRDPYSEWLERPKNLSGRALSEASGFVRVRLPDGSIRKAAEREDVEALLDAGWLLDDSFWSDSIRREHRQA